MTTDPLSRLASLEGVPSAYAAARDGIDVMLRDRGLRRTSPETTTESLLRGAHASAVLEGSTSTLAQVRAGASDEVAADALRVSTELLGLAPALSRTPLQALARIHTLASAGQPEESRGRPRDAEAAERLRGVGELLVAHTAAPALVLAAVVHAELATAAPFASHNGIVARATERLVLVPEAGHLALRAAYESNLRGYATGRTAGVHSWLLYAAEAYAAGAEASPLRLAAE
ncbi:MAG: oxidoreductase [Nocardioides sp.]|nr:oxidoreductase [Nocardioides sp.]